MPEGNRIADAAADRAAGNVQRLEGSGLAQDASELVTQVADGSWTEGLISFASSAMEVGELLKDPVAKLASMGLSWAVEFFAPLNWWLDQLVGDQEQLDRMTLTWEGVAAQLRTTGEELDRYYKTDTAHWTGDGVAQYRKWCGEQVQLYQAASDAAASTAGLVKMSGVILKVVRTIVRETITDCVGDVISLALRYPPPATIAAAPEVADTIVSTGTTIQKWVTKLRRAFTNAEQMLKQSKRLFEDVKAKLRLAREFAARIPDPIRQAKYVPKVRNALVSDSLRHAKDTAKEALGETADEVPKTIAVEGAKESGKQVAKDIDGDGDADGDEAPRYDGPGPHRVSGTL
ncbi:MAG: hypothetical protein GEV28_41070 [Actinophytocola sp.]|uniref:hypothetical protein n=1 Tax=Actinophytocola sp. TaxID=1872138 RepID=UPI00132B0E24|nr:hypothetical protein [Actinophytocola sp.]MPZ86428.1 hypothetical protein [Actinophytocola sp.]